MLNALLLALGSQAAPPAIEPQPDSVVVAAESFDRWDGEVRSYIRWVDDEPFFARAECKLTNKSLSVTFAKSTQYFQEPNPVVRVDRSEIAESAKLEDIDLTGLTVGPRVFQLKQIDWATNGWFHGYIYRGDAIDVRSPSWFLAVREAASDPWLPLGILLPSMLDASRIEVHYRAGEDVEIDPGVEPAGKVVYRVSGIRWAVNWCIETLDSEAIKALPKDILGSQIDHSRAEA